MKFLNEKILLIEGNIYTDMIMDPGLLTGNGITIHVKGDVFFGVMQKPNRLNPKDFYLRYEEFIKTYGHIFDIIAYSQIF